jgi:hypothetical protein
MAVACSLEADYQNFERAANATALRFYATQFGPENRDWKWCDERDMSRVEIKNKMVWFLPEAFGELARASVSLKIMCN